MAELLLPRVEPMAALAALRIGDVTISKLRVLCDVARGFTLASVSSSSRHVSSSASLPSLAGSSPLRL